jgi:hypothetical protein
VFYFIIPYEMHLTSHPTRKLKSQNLILKISFWETARVKKQVHAPHFQQCTSLSYSIKKHLSPLFDGLKSTPTLKGIHVAEILKYKSLDVPGVCVTLLAP